MTGRRGLLALVAGAAALAALLIVRAIGPDTHGARIVRFTIDSRDVGAAMPEVGVTPPGTSEARRPLLVFLHGRGGDGQDANLSSSMFAALAALGSAAPDIVFPNGGEASYWHDRRDGRWAAYVVDEVIPAALARLHADPRRVAIGGVSMGGFGALDIARLHPGRFCAVGADSPALWFRGADTAAGAFDDAQDFARHDLIALAARADPFASTPVWIDVGTSDPFRAGDTAFARGLHARGSRLSFHVWPGGHDNGYWQSHWSDYLGFYTRVFARCRV